MTANRRKKPRNTTAQPGYWAAKHALARFGKHVIDGRSRVAHALDEFRDELIADLGGPEAVSRQQRVLIDLAVKTYLMVQSIDNYILNLDHLVQRKKKALWPIVRERTVLADSLARYMNMLGLARREKPVPSLEDYLASQQEQVGPTENQEENEHVDNARGAGIPGTNGSGSDGSALGDPNVEEIQSEPAESVDVRTAELCDERNEPSGI
jgi:hypothetical protein